VGAGPRDSLCEPYHGTRLDDVLTPQVSSLKLDCPNPEATESLPYYSPDLLLITPTLLEELVRR